MKLTVDIVIFGCYISWVVGNNCFFKWNNSMWFLKEKRNLKKCLTTKNERVKVIKSLEQSRQSQIRRTVPKSGRVRKTLKKTWKKFLTKKKRCDKVKQAVVRQTTLITKQWNTYDSRKFFTFLRTVWKTKTVKREIASCYLEWIKHLIREFDPGSGWTLAACLTHASRTGITLLKLRSI